ncbi:trypsin-like peptidase domain-containing protein [Vibrio parahaemolyticus]|nr:trypsin-like peptidase domain-containing protein [Vibrio parahaemolyticus]MDF4522997.1 trypsin-like peptidase domain-containing protein [Vibrio parahaemolyticus]MDF4541026.1 trypsin-like peptidase domain-containing protein [Vibrio parahaemolyticus]MDF4550177.1 trypsin-like peptidase domain-containing protein [Vibrio parahaemolyticus]
MPKMKYVDPLSGSALYVEPHFNDVKLSTATAFVLRFRESNYLITNWHVVSGRDADTEECLDKKYLAIPNKLKVLFHKKGKLGEWVEKDIPLLDENEEPLWLEHPHSNLVDIVAIPIESNKDIELFPIDFNLKDTDMMPFPALPVSIIGFPLGLFTGTRWPIWKTGHIASDHDIDYEENKPAFLIDATTRSGMSGSPVVMRADSFQTQNGNYSIAAGMQTRLLGGYAGRIHGESEIGRVWRPFLIQEIVEQKLLFNDESGRSRVNRNDNCPCGSLNRFKQCCGTIA